MLPSPNCVQLLPLADHHAEAMYRWMLDPEVSGNIGLRSEPSLQRTYDWIARATESASFMPFAIYLRDRHVGNLIFDDIAPDLESARLSIYIGEPDARNKGLGSQALQLAVEEAFAEGFRAIWLTVHKANERALHTYLKAGFRIVESTAEPIGSHRMNLSHSEWIACRGERR